VLALAASHSGSPVRTFTLAFDHGDYDEASIAEEMAKLVDADRTVVPVTQASLAHDFSDAVWHAESLFVNAHGVAKFALSRAVHNAGYKVVLTGEGSDEILAGYPHFRMDMYRQRGGSGATDVQQALVHSNPVSRGFLLPDGSVRALPVFAERLGYVPAYVETRETVVQKLSQALPPSFQADDVYTSLLDYLDVSNQMTGRHVLNQSLYLWNKILLPGYILTVLGDRMEMSHSVEGRVPFLDHHVVEFTRTLPVTQKIHGTTEKFILREALKPMLPPAVYTREKHPFATPPVLLNEDEPLYQMLQDTLRGNALNRIPFLNKKAVIDLLDCVPTLDNGAKTALGVPMMSLLSACVLSERFQL
jgi:asparagine synthase (glutamine-hydrolysing)